MSSFGYSTPQSEIERGETEDWGGSSQMAAPMSTSSASAMVAAPSSMLGIPTWVLVVGALGVAYMVLKKSNRPALAGYRRRRRSRR